MIVVAKEKEADAVIGVLYTSEFMKDATVNVCAYGTAVKFIQTKKEWQKPLLLMLVDWFLRKIIT
ncbi:MULTISPECIES: heavy metal-binding domain-containing protein [Viridibacillus]|uniref:Uncharacterized protein n=1 Tax=Viridibacillus arenosi FSL R5-213 TaxID=1227360 RepID=W4F3F6_9BACL|nr:hypothetical protein C176_04113 [Viridibacillus arenosi FSL R5-213]OMC80100.1 hypothetical protein BK130_17200 [Viridibacillus sp. FSL H8-0123]OMC87871.1 hypothetical protein BK128_06000 [Viridibacillus sp. FSL H7-0596]OMC91421.1 hypothetical protein BK137_10125 [Viridibacillus arenosi]